MLMSPKPSVRELSLVSNESRGMGPLCGFFNHWRILRGLQGLEVVTPPANKKGHNKVTFCLWEDEAISRLLNCVFENISQDRLQYPTPPFKSV